MTSGGNASTSTLRPTASAVAGSTVEMGSCMRSTLVKNCSSPKVSKRKIACPPRCRCPAFSQACGSPLPAESPTGDYEVDVRLKTDTRMQIEYFVRVRDDDDRLLHNDADRLYEPSPALFQPAPIM